MLIVYAAVQQCFLGLCPLVTFMKGVLDKKAEVKRQPRRDLRSINLCVNMYKQIRLKCQTL